MEKLQYISQGTTRQTQETNIKTALDYGAKWIQIRWKGAPARDLSALCEFTRRLTQEYLSLCLINDHVHLAKEVDADGVHLGLNDGSVIEARKVLGTSKIIGGTANTLIEVRQRREESCDYIGLGPLRFTNTKEKLSPVLGFEGFQYIIEELKNDRLPLPKIYAIGGITLSDLPALQQAGIFGVAVSGLITQQPMLINQIKVILK